MDYTNFDHRLNEHMAPEDRDIKVEFFLSFMEFYCDDCGFVSILN